MSTENGNSVSSSGLRNNESWTSFTWTVWLFHLMQNERRKLISLLWISCQRCFWRGSDRKEMRLPVLWNQNLLIQDSSSQASLKMFLNKPDKGKIQCQSTHLLEVRYLSLTYKWVEHYSSESSKALFFLSFYICISIKTPLIHHIQFILKLHQQQLDKLTQEHSRQV